MDTCVVSNWMTWMQVSIYAKYVSVSRRMTKSIVRRWVEPQRVSKTASGRWCRFLDEHGGGDKWRGMDWCVFVMTGGIVVCFLLTRSDTTHTHTHVPSVASQQSDWSGWVYRLNTETTHVLQNRNIVAFSIPLCARASVCALLTRTKMCSQSHTVGAWLAFRDESCYQ